MVTCQILYPHLHKKTLITTCNCFLQRNKHFRDRELLFSFVLKHSSHRHTYGISRPCYPTVLFFAHSVPQNDLVSLFRLRTRCELMA